MMVRAVLLLCFYFRGCSLRSFSKGIQLMARDDALRSVWSTLLYQEFNQDMAKALAVLLTEPLILTQYFCD